MTWNYHVLDESSFGPDTTTQARETLGQIETQLSPGDRRAAFAAQQPRRRSPLFCGSKFVTITLFPRNQNEKKKKVLLAAANHPWSHEESIAGVGDGAPRRNKRRRRRGGDGEPPGRVAVVQPAQLQPARPCRPLRAALGRSATCPSWRSGL